MMRSIPLLWLLLLGCDAEPVRVLTGLDAGTGVGPTDCSAGGPGCEAVSAGPDAGEQDASSPHDADFAPPEDAKSALPIDAGAEDAPDTGDTSPACRCSEGSEVLCVLFSGESSACLVTNGRRVCQQDGSWGACVGDALMPMPRDGFDLDGAVRGDAGIACRHYVLACPVEIYQEFSTGSCEQTPLCPRSAEAADD